MSAARSVPAAYRRRTVPVHLATYRTACMPSLRGSRPPRRDGGVTDGARSRLGAAAGTGVRGQSEEALR